MKPKQPPADDVVNRFVENTAVAALDRLSTLVERLRVLTPKLPVVRTVGLSAELLVVNERLDALSGYLEHLAASP